MVRYERIYTYLSGNHMTRRVSLPATGLAVVLVVAGAMALVRSDDPDVKLESGSSAPTGVSTGAGVPPASAAVVSNNEPAASAEFTVSPPPALLPVTGDGTPLTSVAVPTTVSAREGPVEPPVLAMEEAPSPTEGEPGIDFVEDPVEVGRTGTGSVTGARDAPAADDGKGRPVAQVGAGTVASSSVTAVESAIDFEEDPDQVPPPKETTTSTSPGSTSGGSVRQARTYTWEDGGNTRQVSLDPDLVVKSGSAVGSTEEVVVEAAAGSVVRSDGGGKDSGLPVFRSSSGALMTLPGGVLLVLDPEWTEAQTNAFFSRNGIKQSRVSGLDYLPNGFFVETDPGFPSLNLANELASQDGVEISSPNWWTESSTR